MAPQTQAQIALGKIQNLERRHAALIAARAKKPAGGVTAPGTGGSGSTGSSTLVNTAGASNGSTGGPSDNNTSGATAGTAHTHGMKGHTHTEQHEHGMDHTHSCSVSIADLWTTIGALTTQINNMSA